MNKNSNVPLFKQYQFGTKWKCQCHATLAETSHAISKQVSAIQVVTHSDLPAHFCS